MNKNDFIDSLKIALKDINKNELNEIIEYYEELISDAIENGENETEFIKGLGGMDNISKKIIAEQTVKEVNERPTTRNKFKAVTAILGAITSPIWLPIAVMLVLVVFVLIISGFLVVLSLAISVIAIVITFIYSFTLVVANPAMLSVSIALLGAAIFLTGIVLVGYRFLFKNVTIGCINYLKRIVLKKGDNKNV